MEGAAPAAPETAGCPKHMVYGPCGGVRPDLSCEVDRRPCPFARLAEPIPWAGTSAVPETTTSRLLRAIEEGPVVVTDLTVPAFDAASVASITEVLRGSTDALLVGEHQDQPDFSPTLMAALVRASGGHPWLTLTCRDRNRVVLEQELASLGPSGADGVLCVTGDARVAGTYPGATEVFDLDGTRLAALASSYGLGVGVAESPGAAPRALRPGRLLHKQRAGAGLVLLNHLGSSEEVEVFVRAARDAGVTIPIIAAVAVYSDARSAQVLAALPGLHLDGRRASRVVEAADPERAGIETAVEQARQLLSIEGVAGVNLSGMASSRGELHAARLKAEIGKRIRGRG
jgi:methylenetetrahydrofolate reductase (NADPH)